MKTVVTGASGMLGSAVVRELKASREKDYAAWYREGAKGLDLRDGDAVRAELRAYRPELIVHAAALTDADFCEDNRAVAREVNALVSENLARRAKEVGARFLFVSTDAVYDDSRLGRRREEERPNPRSVYAETKLEGEGRVLAAYPEALVVRTTMFGWTLPKTPRPKFAEQILAALTARREISLWHDAFFSPLYVGTLAEVLLDLGELDVSGVLNVGARNPISKADFGREIAEQFGLDASLIRRVSVDDTPLRAQRPKNVGLNVSAVSRLLGPMPTVEAEVEVLYGEAHDGTAKKIRGRETYP